VPGFLAIGLGATRRCRLALFALTAVAGAVSCLFYAPVGANHPNAGGGEMIAVAENLVRYGYFGNPSPGRYTGATAVVAPAYPFFLAILLKLFGPHCGRLWVVVFAAVVHGVHAALLIPLSRVVFRDQSPGVWAAVFTVVFPVVRFMPAWEAIFAASGLLAFCLTVARWISGRHFSSLRALALGVMSGLLVLVNPVAALVAVVWTAFRLLAYWKALTRPFMSVACFGLALCVTPLPWAIRNQVLLGAPVIKSGLGWNLYASNNDCAESSLARNFWTGCYDKHTGAREVDLVCQMGELKYNAYRRQTAVDWITANPRAFFYLTVHRVFEFWFPNMAEGPYAVMISFITILSLAGFVLMARWRESFLQFAICASLVYPLTYYVVLSDSRYRIPILWISLLGAGYFMQAVWRLCPRWRTTHKNRKPIAAVTLPPGS